MRGWWGAVVLIAGSAGCGGTQHGGEGTVACPPCPSAAACVDDPRDGCDPWSGGVGCAAVCSSTPCAGIAGIACPSGSVCVFPLGSGCDPRNDADCGGFCAPRA